MGVRPEVQIGAGFGVGDRARVARLFWRGFGRTLVPVLGPEGKACAFLAEAFRPAHALGAWEGAEPVGIVGVQTEAGGLVGGGFRTMAPIYGPLDALWRAALLDRLGRDVRPGEMRLDGLTVAPERRGRGIGSALIGAVLERAAVQGYRAVRLDVEEGNARAQALYARHGFVAMRRYRAGPVAALLGRRGHTEMRHGLDP